MMFPDGFDAVWALQTPIWVFITLSEASRGLGACKGGLWGLSRFRAIWDENDPEKKVSKRVWGYFGGVFMMFSDGFDAFKALPSPIWVIYHPV